jgi:flagellar motor switch protein FliM
MTANSLSVDDVDVLLSASDPIASEGFAELNNEKDLQSCDIASQQRIINEKFPTLAVINERFTASLKDSLLAMLRKPSEVVVTPPQFQAFHELQAAIQAPAHISILTIAPLVGCGLVVCEASLAFALVDTLFGGQSLTYPTAMRDFSATEHSVVQRLTSVVIEQYQQSWSSIYPLKLRLQDSMSDMNLVTIASASEVIVYSTFTIEIGNLKGSFHICFPYSALMPIRDVLVTTAYPKSDAADNEWSKRMSQQVEMAEVELVANFAQVKSSVRDLLALEKGQIFQCVIEKNVIATVSNVPLLNCRFGSKNGRIALKVNHFMNDPTPFFENI